MGSLWSMTSKKEWMIGRTLTVKDPDVRQTQTFSFFLKNKREFFKEKKRRNGTNR
jgi:hypothetical protein